MTSRPVLVDTTAWVDYFADRPTHWVQQLDGYVRRGNVLVGDLVLTEVLQGVRHEREFRRISRTLALWPMKEMCGPDIAFKAAKNYRRLRQRGHTVRGTIDVIIATWCIENRIPLLHNDRDFALMERELGLITA